LEGIRAVSHLNDTKIDGCCGDHALLIPEKQGVLLIGGRIRSDEKRNKKQKDEENIAYFPWWI